MFGIDGNQLDELGALNFKDKLRQLEATVEGNAICCAATVSNSISVG